MKYIRQLIFNHINDISQQLYKGSIYDDGRQRSLVGRDIIKLTLPRLEMVSKFAMPWNYISHYLPTDVDEIEFKQRKRAITQYCHHRNATLDTLVHLLEWSPTVQIEWKYLKNSGCDIK
ncbi:hypothetical protein DFA_00163 [Cavenderia fasciculata]|uniref:Uncharacterized protein n=1 Tax=Cavenderia fasciculata TaxID=261658 RepID=F4PXS5_CACFS|nr:uncharacterized protein DFA_00163 [Cavenderia fasciculata]EGG19585.1 hypothetical protein DFA_00163 [Cavenderia fasciculata]|eukprot:XP_004357879.1 hypothetical protein DFA_00163 [Cavenderia fasciculata]